MILVRDDLQSRKLKIHLSPPLKGEYPAKQGEGVNCSHEV